MSLGLNATPEDIAVFLAEAEEQLQTIEESLLRLEKQEASQELLGEIFRAAHTLKGSSATLGHRTMAELTHIMENVLDGLRREEIELTPAVVDGLLEALDYLKELKEEIVAGEDRAIDTRLVILKLKSLQAEAEAAQQTAATATATAPTAATAAITGAAWEIEVELAQESPMPAVRAFQVIVALEQLGQIIESRPTLREIEAERVGTSLRVQLVSDQSREQLAEAVRVINDVVGVQVAAISREAVLVPLAPVPVPENAPAKPAPVGVSGPASAKTAKKASRQTIRVDIGLLDTLMNLVSELVIDRTRLAQLISHWTEAAGEEQRQALNSTSAHIGRITNELQEQIMKARMLPVDDLFKRFPRMVRDLAARAGKEIEFTMAGQETELDRSMIEEISDPLMHLLRNAVDHGIESPDRRERAGKPRRGEIHLSATHEENHIIIQVSDDGRGIDPAAIRQSAVSKGLLTEEAAGRLSDREAVELIFMPGFSTAETVSDVSGRGVGMDVVRTNIERISGLIDIQSEVGRGTTILIRLPLTLAIIKALLVRVGQGVFAIPLSTVKETSRMRDLAVSSVRGREVVVVRGEVVPLLHLGRLFQEARDGESDHFAVIVNFGGRLVALVVDSLIGEQEVVINNLGRYIGEVDAISGAAILGDGRLALIIDVMSLLKGVVQRNSRG